ncbi:OLC1v1003057C1 [Oldenlandia corymbosa var. corymbosa]|uniref:OLC1v1003057C1 n=1 Tax=Oldenlandia corymbosa var. corymbosa TaxID=529605 RepID=A0AAV1D962_OLDCO|nr:OLC1v1003057C1 [Oldenlandia corymbosa var. corymbosa]
MLRDLKFLRRNSGQNETENVPVNPKDSLGPQVGVDLSSRPPLNVIQEPTQISKGVVDQEFSVRANKIDRTPTKSKGATPMHLRTPEKHGMKHRFGWTQKGDSSSAASESKDEGKVDISGNTSQLRSLANFITPRPSRPVGKANSECSSTQSTPTKSVSKPPNPGFSLASGSRLPSSGGGSRMSNFSALSKGIPISCNSVTVVNTVEVPRFELKEDPSFWLEHNVQVLIRVRPLNNAEKGNSGYARCLKQESAQSITWIGQPETRFTFDHVACESIDQETLFRMVGLPMVENCLSGYNSCMFAYGQTGSGKTHTMLGDIEDLEIKPSLNRGMTPRIFEFLFARIRAEEESRQDEKLRYHCKCSFLEIYNEQITDLLDPSSTNLLLREDMKKGVYVENLSEFEVQTVGDIIRLLRQGSSNRKVAATNMNRESSRSHSVFTCEIESRWEKDSTCNFRFARLNLVDLAGSERQKTSGAEGERLKEAANINKSLSTLGHVIMVLVDVANGRPRHVPYRDSRLTFLLQDSLGGNSKTTIIANVSPSICCAAETLNTLKFAQRAKLIQNNAVVNEDSSGDVVALQSQIRLLKEELSLLKRQNVSRALSFGPVDPAYKLYEVDDSCSEDPVATDLRTHSLNKEPKGSLRLSTRQFKTLESTLAGALRREQMADISIKQLEAEIEQLNRLVQQREEDTRCTKMMLKFREDKIQRMESLVGGLIPPDVFLVEENSMLANEIQLLRAKVEKNPEVTRFALENIRLLEQLRRFQDFYEEGEREMLLAEVSQLRDQFILSLDGNLKQHPQEANISKENISLQQELKKTQGELEECRNNLNRCLEYNNKLNREVENLRLSLNFGRSLEDDHDSSTEVIKESISEAPSFTNQSMVALRNEKKETLQGKMKEPLEEVLDLQLELDILKIILKEERSTRYEMEERAQAWLKDLNLSKERALFFAEQSEALREQLKEAKAIIEALECQQLLSINELEDLRNNNCHFGEKLHKQELELSSLKAQKHRQVFRKISSCQLSENEDSPMEKRLNKMHDSLEKAKRLNKRYQSDKAFQASHEEEMDEVRMQVEAETAEVIMCLQEELSLLQEEVQASNLKQLESKETLTLLQTQMKDLEEKLSALTNENTRLNNLLESKDSELTNFSEEWELLTSEIEAVLQGGHESLNDASDELYAISSSFPQKRSWISGQFDKMAKCNFEKELIIEELNHYLEDASNKRKDMDCMLNSLRGAAMVMTEAHQQECCQKDQEIFFLTSQLTAETSTVSELKEKIMRGEDQLRKTSTCATVAFVMVNRLSELNSKYLDELKYKDVQLMELADANVGKDNIIQRQASLVDDTERQIQSLRKDKEALESSCSDLGRKLSEEQNRADALGQELQEYEENTILRTGEKLKELQNGVSEVRSCIKDYVQGDGSSARADPTEDSSCLSNDENDEIRTGTKRITDANYLADIGKHKDENSINRKNLERRSKLKDVNNRDATIMLLKKEIESALESLNGVQAEIAELRSEKKRFSISEKESQRGIESILGQVLALSNAMDYLDKEFNIKINALEGKLQGFDRVLQCSCDSWFEQKELLEVELDDARVISTQKDTEASCILAKFEEVQNTMKDADIIINELMIANETLKLEVSEMKKKETLLVRERDSLINKVQRLEFTNGQKDGQLQEMEHRSKSDIEMMSNLMQELEHIVSQVQMASMEHCSSIASDCLSIKALFLDSMEQLSSYLEEIWSEIILKDTAISVLHLCHMGIVLEAVTGLNAEKGLLSHGLEESNTVISKLRNQNVQSIRELESCRTLEGKLLADIKNGFDRISRKEDETGELRLKLTAFERKISDLQFEEELMIQRSNSIGAEFTTLMKDLDLNNRDMLESFQDHERLLKEKEELLQSREECFLVEMCAKDIELLILSVQLEQVNAINADVEKAQLNSCEAFETCKEALVLQIIDASLTQLILKEREVELGLVHNNFDKTGKELQDLLSKLETRNATIAQMEGLNRTLLSDVESLKHVEALNDDLKVRLDEAMEAKQLLSLQVDKLKPECEKLIEEKKMMEVALEVSSGQVSSLEEQNKKLQNDNYLLESTYLQLQNKLDTTDSELRKLSCIEQEEKSLQAEILKVKEEYRLLLQDLENKKDDLEASSREKEIQLHDNQALRCRNSLLENQAAALQTELDLAKAKAHELQLHESVAKDDMLSTIQDLQAQVFRFTDFQEENAILRDELRGQMNQKQEYLSALSLKLAKSLNSMENVQASCGNMSYLVTAEATVLDNMFEELRVGFGRISRFLEEFEYLENLAKELTSETDTLKTELSRKDDILNGLLFDMSTLQESASISMDQKEEIGLLLASVDALEKELKLKSANLDETVAKVRGLDAQLKEKICMISALEKDTSEQQERVLSLTSLNADLLAKMEDGLKAMKSMEEELVDKRKVIEDLEAEIVKTEAVLHETSCKVESLQRKLNDVTAERDDLHEKVLVLKQELEMTHSVAEEAQEMAEIRKLHIEDKEEEVKLLERSVEELESTVNVLENKVEILKGEAERQRLEREELEIELQAIRGQMQSVNKYDADMKRKLDDRERILEETCQRVQFLEKEIAARDAEITRCKVHISELNLHAEAQGSEYKQKFKVLEAMLEQVKQEVPANIIANSSANKLEKNASKPRGSGSPFKCIGLGIAQQIKSEKEEELSARRQRIEELEALAASRQKEIFMLNARLATAESMTHDVIRDLLGLKLDMNSCATLLDNKQVQMLMDKAQLHNVQEEEVIKLKQQLNEFIKERKGWIEEMDRKQAEMVTAQVALEKLLQRDQLLTTENDILKVESTNYRKRVTELETEVKKLSGQQNLQQRIHHHAKIKEENNMLKCQNDELSMKLRKTEGLLLRVNQELAHYRAADGKGPSINFDEEQRLNNKLKETETERFQLAQELISLCTSILKVSSKNLMPRRFTQAFLDHIFQSFDTSSLN